MKKIFLILILVIGLFAQISDNLLYIEAKLYPKMIMLSNGFYYKNKIKIALIANEKTIKEAEKFKSFIKSSKFDVKIIKNVDLNYDVYILTYDIDNKIIQKLIKHKKLIFALDPALIKKSMFSVYIGVRVYPLINPNLIKAANININPVIFKVAKIYED